jgi:hypothetical protein
LALETLLAYNVQDTITLENLMVTAYNMKLRQTPFYETHLVEEPTLPGNPYSTDLATVDRIKNSSQYWLIPAMVLISWANLDILNFHLQ